MSDNRYASGQVPRVGDVAMVCNTDEYEQHEHLGKIKIYCHQISNTLICDQAGVYWFPRELYKIGRFERVETSRAGLTRRDKIKGGMKWTKRVKY